MFVNLFVCQCKVLIGYYEIHLSMFSTFCFKKSCWRNKKFLQIKRSCTVRSTGALIEWKEIFCSGRTSALAKPTHGPVIFTQCSIIFQFKTYRIQSIWMQKLNCNLSTGYWMIPLLVAFIFQQIIPFSIYQTMIFLSYITSFCSRAASISDSIVLLFSFAFWQLTLCGFVGPGDSQFQFVSVYRHGK